MNNVPPKVSCLMVTANRVPLARRAVLCFQNQTYPNKELIVIDDGSEDYSELFSGLSSDEYRYIKIENDKNLLLGDLRNLALDNARGEFLVQWDDDDWYHPERISKQAEILINGYDACCLSASLMHLDSTDFFNLPYIGYLPDGIPGSIMHRNDASIRYPSYRRSEDTVYLKKWKRKKYTKLPPDDAGLFIRCFHGNNTWEKEHFTRRFRNSPISWSLFIYYRYIRGDLSGHPRFRLPEHVKLAFDQYIKDSETFSLFQKDTTD